MHQFNTFPLYKIMTLKEEQQKGKHFAEICRVCKLKQASTGTKKFTFDS